MRRVAEPFGVLHDVGGENDGGAAAAGSDDFILEHSLVDRIEAGEGLVEQEQFWRIDQGGGEHLDFLGPAPLIGRSTPGRRRRGRGRSVRSTGRSPGGPFSRRLAFEAAGINDGVERRHAPIKAALLGQETDVGRCSPLAAVGAQYVDACRRSADQVQDHPQGRGLAGAIGPRKPTSSPSAMEKLS